MFMTDVPPPPPTVEVWWAMPDGGNANHVTWPQTYLPDPSKLQCGVSYQVDTYLSTEAPIFTADNVLYLGEDYKSATQRGAISWRFVDGPACATPTPTPEPTVTPTPTPTPNVTPVPVPTTPPAPPEQLAETGSVPVGGFFYAGFAVLFGIGLVFARRWWDKRGPGGTAVVTA